jgi:hypothetical protein
VALTNAADAARVRKVSRPRTVDFAHLRAEDLAGRRRRSGENHGDAVRDAAVADVQRVGGNVRERRRGDEVGDGAGGARLHGHERQV